MVAAETELPLEKIEGFITCIYDEHWWLACVLQIDSEECEVKVSILHPNGPAYSFKYPHIPKIFFGYP